MGNPFNKFYDSVNLFKTKFESIKGFQELYLKDYASIEELQKASEKLVELDKTLVDGKVDNDILEAKEKAVKHLDTQKENLRREALLEEKIKEGLDLTPEEMELKAKEEAWEKKNKEYQEFKKKFGIDSEIKKTGQAVSAAANDIDKLSETLSGKVTVDDMALAASQIDNGFDQTLSDVAYIVTGDESTKFMEGWARSRFGDKTYETASAIKNGASMAISGVGDFMSLGDIFAGSWRDPATAAKKIQNGLKTIQSAVTKISTVAKNVYSAVTGKESVLLEKLDNFNSMGIGTAGAFAGAVNIGIGSVNSFSQGNIGAGIAGIKDSIKSARKAYSDLKGKELLNERIALERDKRALAQKLDEEEFSPQPEIMEHSSSPNSELSEVLGDSIDPPTDKQIGDSSVNSDPCANASSSCGGNEETHDDFSADMISEINVVLDGSSSLQNSFCTINGENYKLSGYSLSQELLQPMILNFSMEKENKIETQSDVVFADTTQLIGKSFELNVSTIKTSHEDSNAKPQKAFVFKGMIIDVSAARATASTQSASVIVATWDALLQNAPHCRSFENMTLKDIIESVLKPYSDIKSKISPRFKEKIPYIVQYNQSDYAFISMLAVRFGEWMYNTGETFIFGEIEDSGSSANLEYPGGSLMSYDLHQSMTSFSFNHLLTDYYHYGNEKAVLKESAQGVADGTVNNWTDKAFNASMQRFKNEQIAILNAGGFDSGKEYEGSDSILDYSLKIEAQGKKTGIMTVHGFSKLAMLKIGQTFLIRDNVQNKSGESNDVEQKALKVIGINHSFDYRQEYSNSFTAIPVACNYPSYSDADVFPSAPQQRAKVVENKDEQKLGRIRVQFPWQEIQSKEMKTPWLRIAVPYAGVSKGHQFVPEIGEEVMVGFEMNNAERPYIIGSFYNGGNGKPDENWAVSKEEDCTTNNIKAIRTRNGHTILFNDKGDAGLLEIYDNKNNTYHITLSADDKKITIYSAGNVEVIADNDINVNAGNNIAVNAEGDITVNAKGDIGMNADGNIGIKSKGNISMEAKKEVSIQASKVKVR